MRRDPTWLPPGNLEIAHRLDGVLRRMADPDGSNRWLRHRWSRLANELREDLHDLFSFPPGFVAICLGAGKRNGLSFPFLIGLMGAGRVEAIEPEPLDPDEEWRLLQGLAETALHALAGESGVAGLDTAPEALSRFVHLGPLFRGESVAQSLTSALVWKRGTAESPDLPSESVDLVTSRSVMEHVANPADAYKAMARALRPGGVLHHDIDFTAHDADQFAFYRRPQVAPGGALDGLNEMRLSDHVAILRGLELEVTVKRQQRNPGTIDRTTLAPRFASYEDADLLTTRAVLVARKGSPIVRA
jgi:SAM-dependent methyltransferase